jgi:hypothetical protein
MYCSQVVWAHLELVCPRGDEFRRCERWAEVWDEESSQSDVERKDWLNAMRHEKGGVAGGFAGCCTVSPED